MGEDWAIADGSAKGSLRIHSGGEPVVAPVPELAELEARVARTVIGRCAPDSSGRAGFCAAIQLGIVGIEVADRGRA